MENISGISPFAFAWCCDESCFTSPPIFLPKRNSYPGFGSWNKAASGGGGASQQWPLCSQSFDSNQEDGPGGAGEWIDKNLLFNSVEQAGDVWGRWDAGQASGWELTGRSLWAAGNVIFLATGVAELGIRGGTLAIRASLNGGAESVFYSGSKEALFAARNWAEHNGGKLLENTSGGRVLNVVDKLTGGRVPIRVWEISSKFFAENAVREARGPLNVFTGEASPISIWTRIEEPIIDKAGVSIWERGYVFVRR